MTTNIPAARFVALAMSVLLLGLMISSARAETVIIESRTSSGSVTPDPPYQELPSSTSWLNTAAKSTVPGLTAPGARFVTGPTDRGIVVKPTLQSAGEYYRVEITQNTNNLNVSTDIVVAVAVTGGSGLPETTDVFQAPGSNTWEVIGDLKLDPGVTKPQITFTYLSGTVDGSHRWIFDSIRFTKVIPCLDTPPISVNGPFNAGQTTVTVAGVQTEPVPASLVTVYSINGAILTPIGSLDPAGAASVDVPVTPLVRGTFIAATQTVNNQEGCEPTGGSLVGSGPNPPILLSLGIRETNSAGPVGADGGSTGTIEWVGPKEAYLGAPMGKLVIPSNEWQTVTFNPAAEPVVTFNGDGVIQGTFGTLEHLAIASAPFGQGDSGSYQIYIDSIKSGDAEITGFEGYEAGTAVVFRPPSFSGSTDANLLLPTPDFAGVDDTVADTGTNSYRVEFQFLDGALQRWIRLTSFTTANLPNPQIDLTKPLSIRMLVKPSAESGALSITDPADATVSDGDNAVFSVTASLTPGGPPAHYQWYVNGLPVLGSDGSALTLAGVTMADNGKKIRATAYDGLKRVYSREATLTVVVAPEAIGGIKGKAAGAQVKLKNPVVVTKSNTSEYWVQEQDRSAGIRVVSSQNPPVNTLVSGVEGVLTVDAATTEVYIDAGSKIAAVGAAFTPVPLGVTNRSAGGSSIPGAAGLANDGLLVRVWGKVMGVDYSAPLSIYIDDGSGVENDTPTIFITEKVPGIKVTSEATIPAAGDYLAVTGIVRRTAIVGGPVIRWVEPLSDMDIVKLAP